MMSRMKYLLVFLLGLVFLSNLSFADMHMANGTGGGPCNTTVAATNHTTIQAAINAASAGDTVLVCRNGTSGYTENVNVNKTINLYGNQSGVEVYDASNSNVFQVNESHVNISNFTLSRATNSGNAGIYFFNTSGNCTITNNTAYNNSFGFYLDQSHNNVLISNIAYNTSEFGFSITSSNNNNLTSNIAYNNSNSCFYLQSSNNNTLTSNTGSNNSVFGFSISSSDNNTLTSNIAHSNSQNGFFVHTGSANNNLTSNEAYNNSEHGFNLASDAGNNILTSNTAYNNSQDGFSFDSSNNNTLINNTAYLHLSSSYSGFTFSGSSNNTVYNNTAYNSANGFYCVKACVITTFEGNNVTNVTKYAIHLSNNYLTKHSNQSSLNFSGNNSIYSLNGSAYEVYLFNSTISTGDYNLTTSNSTFNLSFGLVSTSNVSVKVLLLSSTIRTVSSLTDADTGNSLAHLATKIMQSNEENYYGLLVANTSAIATAAPRMYYDSSDTATGLGAGAPGSYSTSYLGVGKTTSGSSWTYYTPTTLNSTLTSIYRTGITSFSYFAPLIYYPTPADSSSGDSGSLSEVEVTHEFDCETGEVVVTVTSGGSTASGVTATLMGVSFGYSSSESTDSEGTALFTITSDGTYKILTSATSEYHSGSESDFSLALCEEAEEEEEPPVEEEPEEPPVEEEPEEEEGEEEPETEETTAEEASEALNSAEEAISSAEGDQTAALAKLEEAQAAYDEGNYELAKSLAEEAITLIEEPSAAPEPQEEPTEPEGEEQDYSWMYILGLVILVVVLVGGYFLLKKKK